MCIWRISDLSLQLNSDKFGPVKFLETCRGKGGKALRFNSYFYKYVEHDKLWLLTRLVN